MAGPHIRDGDQPDAQPWRARQIHGISEEELLAMIQNQSGGSLSAKIVGQTVAVSGRDIVLILAMLIMAVFAFSIVWYVREQQQSLLAQHAANIKVQQVVAEEIRAARQASRREHRMLTYRMDRSECQNSFDFKERGQIRADRRRGVDRLRGECPWIGRDPDDKDTNEGTTHPDAGRPG